MTPDKRQAYWKRNLSTVLTLLAIWFVVSYGFGILFKDALNNIQVFGFKLGFWFAQQGSIYIFVVLIFVYVGIMNKTDREFDVHED
jgi:putative solute:sodium symporter small subunit